VAELPGVASSAQALSAAMPISAAATSILIGDNMFMTCSGLNQQGQRP
jgi:hypothetical protein